MVQSTLITWNLFVSSLISTVSLPTSNLYIFVFYFCTEKLDQTIAEFDQSSAARRHSLHSLDTAGAAPPPGDQKVASVRASHTMKRVSVIGMMEANQPPDPPPPVPAKNATSEPRSGAASKLSPAEMRIKKYHKKGSGGMERSKSTPDLADMDFGADSGAVNVRVGTEGGGADAGGRGGGGAHDKMMASTWSRSHSAYVPAMPGVSIFEKSGFVSDLTKNQADGDRPDVPIRAPLPKRRAPDPPAKGEVVRINTGPTAAQSSVYANVSEEIAARKRESMYESSFRPGTSAQLTDDPSVMTQSLEQAKLQHRKNGSGGSADSLPPHHHYNKPSAISFAEDRVYESAQTFIKKHPNAMLLVTADVHGGKAGVGDPKRPPADRQFYEPEPDYDADSGDDTAKGRPASSSSSLTTVSAMPAARGVSASADSGSATTTSSHLSASSVSSSSTVTVRDHQHHHHHSPAVTVISIGKEGPGRGGGPPPGEKRFSAQSDIPPPPSGSFGSPQLETVRLGKASSSSASSSSSGSRRSSVQSNVSQASSGHGHYGHGHGYDSGSSCIIGRDLRVTEAPPQALPSSVVLVQQQQQRNHGVDVVHHHTPPPHHPPPPPPPPSSHPPPPAPPPPPPPPLPANPPPASFPSERAAAAASKSASAPSFNPAPSSAPGLIPTSDILAAVAQRRARMETDGPRLTERQSSTPSLSTSQRNQEALKAAIAQRRSMLEKKNDSHIVEDIEARLNKNRKLQAAKFFSSDTLRSKAAAKKAEADGAKETPAHPPPPPAPAAAPNDAGKPEMLNASGPAGDKADSKPYAAAPDSKPNANKPAVQPASNKPDLVKPAAAAVATATATAVVVDKTSVARQAAEAAQDRSFSKVVVEPAVNKPKEIMMHKAPAAKSKAPPPPPTAAAPAAAAGKAPEKDAKKSSVDGLQTRGGAPHAAASSEKLAPATSGSGSSTKPTSPTQKSNNTTPLPKVGTIKSNDFLALAEKARQDYLQKISGSSTLKGAAKDSQAKPAAQPSAAKVSEPQPSVIEVQPAKETVAVATTTTAAANPVKVSIRDRISNFENSKLHQNGSGNPKGYEIVGVTDDHSHTEPSLSNGTLRQRSTANGVGVGRDSGGGGGVVVVAPPADFTDGEGAQPQQQQQTQIDIIPPPPCFAADMAVDVSGMPAFGGHDDAASFVSSVSSLSTLSSEHGDSAKAVHHHYDDIIVPPPPPPPGFDDDGHHQQAGEPAYEEIPDNFIPPPVQFTSTELSQQQDGGGGGGGVRSERPFQQKAVDAWRCEDVLDWLDSLDMSQYKPSFARNAVDGQRLQSLERNDYIELGVTPVGHRMDLQRSIKRLMLRHSANS